MRTLIVVTDLGLKFERHRRGCSGSGILEVTYFFSFFAAHQTVLEIERNSELPKKSSYSIDLFLKVVLRIKRMEKNLLLLANLLELILFY